MQFVFFVFIHYAIFLIASTETPYEYDDRSYEVGKRRCPTDGRHHHRRRSRYSESRDRHRGSHRDRDIDDREAKSYYLPKYYSKEYARDDDRRDDDRRDEEKIVLRQIDMQFRPFDKGTARKKLYTLIDDNKPGKVNSPVIITENNEHFYEKPAQVARDAKTHKVPPKVVKSGAATHCNRPNERFESCFAGCASITCDNPRDRLQPCYPFCESGCICVSPYVRDDRTHKCVLPADCTRGLKGVPDLSSVS